MFRSIWRRKKDVALARKWQARVQQSNLEQEHAARRLFLDAYKASEGDGRIILGRGEDLKGRWQWCGLPLSQLLLMHILIMGATGTGKSREIAALLYQILRAGIPTILVDMKSELSDIVLDILVPALIANGHSVGPIRVVRPFAPGVVPCLRLTAPDPSVSREIQVLTLATSLGEAVGKDLQVRMHRAFLRMSALAVEKNLPLTVIADWSASPARFSQVARTSSDPRVREYALREFPRESRASLDALRARLDELFHLKEIRLALSADECLSIPECLESGLTVFDFGSPPAGAEDAMHFIGGPLFGRLARAILSRPLGPSSLPVLVCFEEFQELLGNHQVKQVKRMLALSRFKKATLLFSNQQPAQIADIDPMLLRILRTNAGLELIFRSSTEDATRLAQSLSTRRSDESIATARARLSESIASLPRREFYLWAKDAAFGPQLLRSPQMDLEDLAQMATRLSAAERAAIRRGVVCVPADQVRELEPEYPEEELKPLKKTRGLG